MVGVDAALDFPLYFKLKPVVKGLAAPSDLVAMCAFRKQEEADVLSSHGDATRYFVTFLDNHDVKERIRYTQLMLRTSGEFRLLQFRGVNFVMFCDGPMNAEYHRPGLTGQLRDAKGPLAPFDMGLRNVNHVTHGLLLPRASSSCSITPSI
jgi:hypothetical protein